MCICMCVCVCVCVCVCMSRLCVVGLLDPLNTLSSASNLRASDRVAKRDDDLDVLIRKRFDCIKGDKRMKVGR